MSKQDPFNVPKKMQPRYEEIVAIAVEACQTHLNADYASLSRKMAAALARKRPSPLEEGRAKSWAAGIVYTLARINFLFDKSQTPHLTATELCQALGVSQGTASKKSADIWAILDLLPMHPDYCLPNLLEDNLLVWMLSVNGLIVDIRDMPREVQVQAYQQGLIPYVPADRGPG